MKGAHMKDQTNSENFTATTHVESSIFLVLTVKLGNCVNDSLDWEGKICYCEFWLLSRIKLQIKHSLINHKYIVKQMGIFHPLSQCQQVSFSPLPFSFFEYSYHPDKIIERLNSYLDNYM